MDLKIAEVFSRYSTSLRLAGVDPNPVHTAAFASLFSNHKIKVSVSTCQFEDYKTDQDFDVIHFAHCLYYFEKLLPSLQKAIQLLKPDGCLLVLLAPLESLNALADRLWRKQWSRSAWYSHDVMTTVSELGTVLQHERINAWIDITSCLNANDKRGQAILDFIAQIDTSRLTANFQELLCEYLYTITERHSDRYLAPHPVDAFIVQNT